MARCQDKQERSSPGATLRKIQDHTLATFGMSLDILEGLRELQFNGCMKDKLMIILKDPVGDIRHECNSLTHENVERLSGQQVRGDAYTYMINGRRLKMSPNSWTSTTSPTASRARSRDCGAPIGASATSPQ